MEQFSLRLSHKSTGQEFSSHDGFAFFCKH
nr:MAG TPA: hypothetical protein [Caudoviricetes sp.]